MSEFQRVAASYEPIMRRRVRWAWWQGFMVGAMAAMLVLAAAALIGAYMAIN